METLTSRNAFFFLNDVIEMPRRRTNLDWKTLVAVVAESLGPVASSVQDSNPRDAQPHALDGPTVALGRTLWMSYTTPATRKS